MARPRQPIRVLEMKGKKHLTEKEKQQRKSQEVKAKNDKVRAPTYLSKPQKREFNKLAKQLLDIDIMSNLDVDSLARYIIAQDAYNQINQMFNEKPKLLLDKDATFVRDTYFKQCRQLASDLGLNISSRCKIVLPTQPEQPQNKFSKFMAK